MITVKHEEFSKCPSKELIRVGSSFIVGTRFVENNSTKVKWVLGFHNSRKVPTYKKEFDNFGDFREAIKRIDMLRGNSEWSFRKAWEKTLGTKNLQVSYSEKPQKVRKRRVFSLKRSKRKTVPDSKRGKIGKYRFYIKTKLNEAGYGGRQNDILKRVFVYKTKYALDPMNDIAVTFTDAITDSYYVGEGYKWVILIYERGHKGVRGCLMEKVEVQL